MSYLKEMRKKEKTKEKRSQEHKCSGCPYSTWYGEKVYCPFMRCFYFIYNKVTNK